MTDQPKGTNQLVATELGLRGKARMNIRSPFARLLGPHTAYRHFQRTVFGSSCYERRNMADKINPPYVVHIHSNHGSVKSGYLTYLCDQVTGCPILNLTTSSVSSPLCTSNTELRLTNLLKGLNSLSIYQLQPSTKRRRGATRVARMKPRLRMKLPIMKMRKMRMAQMRRVKVMGQASPWDS